jgi:transcriptional regulator with XRE-family HTH domain
MDYRKIGRRIRNTRTNLNLTREKLAELLDLSTNFVGHIERGEKKMSLETLVKIAATLHVSIDYLIYGIHANEKPEIDKLHQLIEKCSLPEINAITDVIKSLLPHLSKPK